MPRWTGPGRFTAQGDLALSRSRLADLQSKARKVVGDLENRVRLGQIWYGRRTIKLEEGVVVEAVVSSIFPDNPMVQARLVIQARSESETSLVVELTGLLSWVEQPKKNGVPVGLPYPQLAFNVAEPGVPSPYVFDGDHVSLVSTPRRLRPFNRAYPQGIQSGNVDWVSTSRQIQISWAGPNSRSFGVGTGRKVYERGVVIAEIPSAYGNVNGAAIDSQGRVIAIAYGNNELTALRTTSSGWEVLDTFALDSNPSSELFTVGTPSFFKGDGLEATTIAYYRPFGAAQTSRTAKITFDSISFSAEYKTVDTELKTIGYVASGKAVNSSGTSTLSLVALSYTPPEPPVWAPYSGTYPIVVDYKGDTKLELEVTVGNGYGSVVTGTLVDSLVRDDTGFWVGPLMESDTSTSGSYFYEFRVGGGSKFLLNGTVVSDLPNYGEVIYYERGSGSISGTGTASYTVAENDDVSGGGTRTVTAQGIVNSDPSAVKAISRFFFCDVRNERYGYFHTVLSGVFSAGDISWSGSDSLSADTTGTSKLGFASITNMDYSGQTNNSTTTALSGGEQLISFGNLGDVHSTAAGVPSTASGSGDPLTSPRCPADFTFGAFLQNNVSVSNPRGPGFFNETEGLGLASIRGFFNDRDFGDINGAASIQHVRGDYLLVADAAQGDVSISGIILNGSVAPENFDSTFQLGVF